MDLLKKLPWWCWGLLLAVVLVSIAIATGAAQAAGGALLALVGSGLIAHRANRRARSINDQLGDRLAVERHAVDALNEEQERGSRQPNQPALRAAFRPRRRSHQAGRGRGSLGVRLDPPQVAALRDRLTEYLKAHSYLLPGGRGSQKSNGVRWIFTKAHTWDFGPDRVFEWAAGDARHVVRRATLATYIARWETKNFHPPKLRWGWSVANNAARRVDLDPSVASVVLVEQRDPFWGGVFLVGDLVSGWNEHGFAREAYNRSCVRRLEQIARAEMRKRGE